jgi:hypothetical protein
MGVDLEFFGGRGVRRRQSASLDRQYPFDFNYFAQSLFAVFRTVIFIKRISRVTGNAKPYNWWISHSWSTVKARACVSGQSERSAVPIHPRSGVLVNTIPSSTKISAFCSTNCI